MLSLRLRYRLPDFGAAVGALIDEVDLGHAPMGLDLPDVHREQSHAAGADNRRCLNFAVLDIGWHVGSPSQRKQRKPQPRANLFADHGCPSSTLSNVRRTTTHCSCVWHSCNIRCSHIFELEIMDLMRSGPACLDFARECDRDGGQHQYHADRRKSVASTTSMKPPACCSAWSLPRRGAPRCLGACRCRRVRRSKRGRAPARRYSCGVARYREFASAEADHALLLSCQSSTIRNRESAFS